MRELIESIEFICRQKIKRPNALKAELQAAFVDNIGSKKIRSVLSTDSFAMRFSEATTGSFSNTVLSLSALKAYDDKPFVVVVARPDRVDFLLANTTFLKKISHSSHQLRVDNIKGSFNGSDIMTLYEGWENTPDNFEPLFALHSAFLWEENVERLVESTNAIVGRDNRFQPSDIEKAIIMAAPERAAAALAGPEFIEVERELCQLLNDRRGAILEAAQIDNVNLRGNAIEQLLTKSGNAHDLGDMVRPLGNGQMVIDIKTKLLDRASAPKAYNVDKMLRHLAEPESMPAFFMVAVSTQARTVSGRLLPVLECALLETTCVQHHWAGRTSRGVTQLSGNFGRASAPTYEPTINVDRARSFLQELLNL